MCHFLRETQGEKPVLQGTGIVPAGMSVKRDRKVGAATGKGEFLCFAPRNRKRKAPETAAGFVPSTYAAR